MIDPSNIGPPRRAERFFKYFCDQEYFEELQGDLEEKFFINMKRLGQRKAKSIYRNEVLKMLRPSVIKKVKTQTQLNNTAMFKNYTLIAFRSIARNKLFSAINVVGLAISMAVGLLAITFLAELNSYDTFHINADRIYRVINTAYEPNQDPGLYATTSPLTGKRLKEEFAGFEKVVTIYRNFNGDAKKGDNTVSIRGLVATEEFFDIFTFPLIYGDPAQALKNPMSLVLTETSALALFGKTDVVGKIIEWDRGLQITVTGVAQNPPRKSHIQFNAVGSFSTLELMNRNNPSFMSWENMWNSHVYALLPKGEGIAPLQASLDKISEEENAKLKNWSIEMGLQSMSSVFPGKKLYNEIGARMDMKTVNSIVILALIVLASACFNYTNLSIARTLKRAKEVGVRKVIGARRAQLLFQFIIEAIIISLLALFFAFFIFQLLKPEFLAMDRNIQRYITLDLALSTYLYFFLFALAIGLIAGFLPSLALSKLRVSNILKGVSGIGANNKFNVRKLLIGIQFTLSMAFVIMVTLTYKQYKYVLGYDLGFTSENVLNINLQGNDVQTLINSFSQLPEISEISAASAVPSTGGMWMDRGKYIEGNDSLSLYNLHISPEYLDNLGHTLLAGTTFSETQGRNQIIINEQLLKRFQMGEPFDALGKTIRIQGKARNVIGVVKDFHYGMLDNVIEPFVFLGDPNEFNMINLKVASTDIVATMQKLEEKWIEIDGIHPFQAIFYDDRIEQAYSKLASSMKILGLLALIAISISMLGLLGMAVYTTETRIKELTIRKVLGANGTNLISLLSKNFILLFLAASAVAIPVTFYAFKEMVVSQMKYVIDIGALELGSGALIVLIIALLTIGSQTRKAIRTNPVNHLRNE